jgi:hypothetical protein
MIIFIVIVSKNDICIKLNNINFVGAKCNKSNKIPDDLKKALLNSKDSNDNGRKASVKLRKFPYPFSSMLSICSDIDGTTAEEFARYHKYLNTQSKTAYGRGLGLDIGDSCWMYMANSHTQSVVDEKKHGLDHIMTFFNGIDAKKKHNANLIVHYFKAGWIDSIHGFGDFSRSNYNEAYCDRNLAIEAWKALKLAGIKPIIWINHGNQANKENFGSYTRGFMSYQQGDNPKSRFYHTDVTLKNGIKFVWASLSQKQFGCDFPLYEISSRDGQKVWGFKRYTGKYKMRDFLWLWNPRRIAEQLTSVNLNSIVNNNQYSIVAQHLGGLNTGFPFSAQGVAALKRLSSYQQNGKILITRTSRLLNYAEVTKFLHYCTVKENGQTYINIEYVKDPVLGEFKPTLNQIRGLTFYVDNPNTTHLFLSLVPINKNEIEKDKPDRLKRKSISIKWFKPDYTDYTRHR